jgi:hypothetical protein
MLLPVISAKAESIFLPELDMLSLNATLIVEGVYKGNNEITVTKVYKSPTKETGIFESIEIQSLDEHDRLLNAYFSTISEELSTKKLVAFLVQNPTTKQWYPLSTHSSVNGVGSAGIIWFDATNCYSYTQTMNPGPLSLCQTSGRLLPKTPKKLKQQVAWWIRLAKAWQKTLSLPTSPQKAKEVLSYLLHYSSPAGTSRAYQTLAYQNASNVKEFATPVLVNLLKHAPEDEDFNAICSTIANIGPPAKATAPYLKQLLKPGDPKRYAVKIALKKIKVNSRELCNCIVALGELVEEGEGSKIHIAKYKILKQFHGDTLTADTISVGYYFYTWEGPLPKTAFLNLQTYTLSNDFPNYYTAVEYNAKESFIVPREQKKIDGLNYWGIFGCGDSVHSPENCVSTGESAAMFDRLVGELEEANVNYMWHKDRYISIDYK